MPFASLSRELSRLLGRYDRLVAPEARRELAEGAERLLNWWLHPTHEADERARVFASGVDLCAFFAGPKVDGAAIMRRWPHMHVHVEDRFSLWLRSLETFLRRISEDQASLSTVFGWPAGARIRSIATNLSDPHCGGTTVYRVAVEGGVDVHYKPRPVALEALAHELALRLTDDGCVSYQFAPRCLDFGGHGYSASLHPEPVDMIDAYYSAAGELLALATLIGMNDCHFENVVATSRGPVLVDWETLGSCGALSSAPARLQDQVAATGLLPDAAFVEGDTSGLFGGAADTPPLQEPANRPRAFCRTADKKALRHISRGFEEGLPRIVDWFGGNAGFASSWAARVHAQPARIVFRPTQFYYDILSELDKPWLVGPRDRHAYVSSILAMATLEQPPPGIATAERRSLLRGDIPRFVLGADGFLRDGDRMRAAFVRRDDWRILARYDDLPAAKASIERSLQSAAALEHS